MAQASRRQVLEANLAAGANVAVALSVPTSPRERVNFHNIWGGVSVEPETADANVQGTWVLYILRENITGITWTDSIFNNETNNPVIIACGVFSASNQSPWTSPPIHPETSRTLEPGDNLVLACTITGATAGNSSCRVMLCAHTTRK